MLKSTLDLDALFARNRALYGNTMMIEGGGDGGEGGDGQGQQQSQENGQQATGTPAAPVPTPPPSAPQQPAQPPAAPPAGEPKVEDLPDWAQKIVRDARDGEAKARTNAKAQAATEAAEQAKAEMAQTIGKALGLVKDDEAVTPEKLAADLEASQKAQTDTERELAIYRAAGAHNADPAKLLDSRSFLTTVKDIDPADADKIAAAIKTAVDNNASLKAARAAGQSSADHAGGSGEGKAKAGSLTEAVGQHYGT